MATNRQLLIDQLYENVPEALRLLPQWVVWRLEKRNDKPTKVPYSAVHYTKAKATKSTTWTSFAQACQAYLQGNYAGIGFVFSEHDSFVGVDFDHCVEAGVIRPDILAHVHSLNSYTEYSQSGTGLHVIVQGKLPAGGRKSTQHRIEMYDSARFFVMTGNHLPNTPTSIAEAQIALIQLHGTVFGQVVSGGTSAPTTGSLSDDQALLNRMFASKHGARIAALWQGDTSANHHDHSKADLALCRYLAIWTNGDAAWMDRLFRQSRLMRPKWDQKARQGETYGQGTIARALVGPPPPRLAASPTSATYPDAEVSVGPGRQTACSAHALPMIVVNHRQLAAITDDALAALIACNQAQSTLPEIYVRGGMLMRVIRDENGEHSAQLLSESAARGILARTATWMKTSVDKTGQINMQPTFPPTAVVRDLLHLAHWPGLPKLAGLVYCPTFAPTGELHAEYGYHSATQLFNACMLRMGEIQVTTAHIQAAKQLFMQELLGDFPFDSPASQAHAVALALLPFVRPLIDGPTPIHAIDAPTPGTGKGLLANACAYAARGRDLAATPAAQDDNEWRKRLTSVLLRADSHILIDNINQPLDSASLAVALSQPVWSDRLLGQTCTLSFPINQIWIATGNNLVTSDEIARRCVRIRLDANVERPDQRQHFKHNNLSRWVHQHRLPLMTAAVTLIAAWIQEGMPRFTAHRKGSYEMWGEVMGGILQTIGVDGFLQNEHEMYDTATTETARLVEFVEGWYQRYGEQSVQVKELFQLASRPDGPVPPQEQGQWRALLEDALGSGNEQSRRTKLGRLLELNKDKIITGYKLRKHTEDKKRPRFSLHRLG